MWYTLTILLTASPLILGALVYFVNYLDREFYKYPFYEEDAADHEA